MTNETYFLAQRIKSDITKLEEKQEWLKDIMKNNDQELLFKVVSFAYELSCNQIDILTYQFDEL